MLAAVEMALDAGVPTKQYVLNLLGRLVELPPPELIDAPQALVLRIELHASVTRYDCLREVCHVA